MMLRQTEPSLITPSSPQYDLNTVERCKTVIIVLLLPFQLFLEVLPEDSTKWVSRTRAYRNKYEEIKNKVGFSLSQCTDNIIFGHKKLGEGKQMCSPPL